MEAKVEESTTELTIAQDKDGQRQRTASSSVPETDSGTENISTREKSHSLPSPRNDASIMYTPSLPSSSISLTPPQASKPLSPSSSTSSLSSASTTSSLALNSSGTLPITSSASTSVPSVNSTSSIPTDPSSDVRNASASDVRNTSSDVRYTPPLQPRVISNSSLPPPSYLPPSSIPLSHRGQSHLAQYPMSPPYDPNSIRSAAMVYFDSPPPSYPQMYGVPSQVMHQQNYQHHPISHDYPVPEAYYQANSSYSRYPSDYQSYPNNSASYPVNSAYGPAHPQVDYVTGYVAQDRLPYMAHVPTEGPSSLSPPHELPQIARAPSGLEFWAHSTTPPGAFHIANAGHNNQQAGYVVDSMEQDRSGMVRSGSYGVYAPPDNKQPESPMHQRHFYNQSIRSVWPTPPAEPVPVVDEDLEIPPPPPGGAGPPPVSIARGGPSLPLRAQSVAQWTSSATTTTSAQLTATALGHSASSPALTETPGNKKQDVSQENVESGEKGSLKELHAARAASAGTLVKLDHTPQHQKRKFRLPGLISSLSNSQPAAVLPIQQPEPPRPQPEVAVGVDSAAGPPSSPPGHSAVHLHTVSEQREVVTTTKTTELKYSQDFDIAMKAQKKTLFYQRVACVMTCCCCVATIVTCAAVGALYAN